MNVTCSGCPAKYAVPDEKVRGKKVRITCKHCGTNIIVDGNALGADQSVAPKLAEPAKAPVVAETTYIVGFSDERQEPHRVSEIIALYRSREIDEETLVWKDGMPDWLPPFDVPELATAFAKAGVVRRAPNFALASAPDDEHTLVAHSASPFDHDHSEATSAAKLELDLPREPAKSAAIRQSAPEVELGSVPSAPTKPAPQTTATATPTTAAATVKPSAAVRTERRAAVDLFGSVAQAGSERDSSLDFGFPQETEHKLTGARNESSVLFSLDALTKPDANAAGQKRARDKEQEKEASAALFGDNGPHSLMNMSGAGFSPLAAPDFTKPVSVMPEPQVRPSDPVEVPNNAGDKKRGGGVWLLALLGIAAAAGGALFLTQKKAFTVKAEEPAATEVQAAAPTQPSSAEAPSAPDALAAPLAGAAASPTTSPAEAAARALTAAGAKPSATSPSPAPATPAAPAVAAAGAKPSEPKKPDAAATTATTGTATATAAAADGAAFDKGAAVTALSAAAANAASCKTPDGPIGSGKVSVTFAPSGRATMTNVGGAFAGTDVGGCVARLFRAARVPAFAGDPVTVSKSFSIE